MFVSKWLMQARGAAKSVLSPLEALIQIQLGLVPPLGTQRSFLLEHYPKQLESRSITEIQLLAMDGKYCYQLFRSLVYEQYFSCVPFRVFAFDMEFTGPPVFTADGPTEDITELGLYSPERKEQFSCLVKPVCGRKLAPGVAELTKMSDEMLEKEGLPFDEAWKKFLDFVSTPDPNELPGSDERILLLSHGGKLADVSLIKWTLEKHNLDLPSSFVFGDTINIIRDAHRRRPVTVDKHPPSWKLSDLVAWLKIPVVSAHRAGNDAKMTWDAIYHTLDRYGDDGLTPREQLVSRFFDDEAKEIMRQSQTGKRKGGAALGEEGPRLTEADLEFDFDDVFKSSSTQGEVELDLGEDAPAIEEFTLEGDSDTVPKKAVSSSPPKESAPVKAPLAKKKGKKVSKAKKKEGL